MKKIALVLLLGGFILGGSIAEAAMGNGLAVRECINITTGAKTTWYDGRCYCDGVQIYYGAHCSDTRVLPYCFVDTDWGSVDALQCLFWLL